jgi:hypothetical protein
VSTTGVPAWRDSNGQTEYFSSCFAELKDEDRFDELTCQKRAAAEFAQNTPGLQLCVGALSRSAELGMGGVGGLL